MSFTNLEKKSVAKLLLAIGMSDGEGHPDELKIIIELLQADRSLLTQAVDISTEDAMKIIPSLSEEKKSEFCEMMYKVIIADDIVRPSEIEFVSMILNKTQLSKNLVNYCLNLHVIIMASKLNTSLGL